MLILIAAQTKNRVIGKDGKMPWHLPADLRYFRETTSGHTVVMGRKTYESMGRPLPNRRNIILTRQKDLKIEGCEVFNDIEEVKKQFKDEEVFVIGGAEIYELSLPFADRVYLTEIDAELDGDTFFPEIDKSKWREISRKTYIKDEKNKYSLDFVIYEKL